MKCSVEGVFGALAYLGDMADLHRDNDDVTYPGLDCGVDLDGMCSTMQRAMSSIVVDDFIGGIALYGIDDDELRT